MHLSDTKIRAATAKTKVYRLNDGDGLSLEIKPTGKKIWRFRYRFDGKENMVSLGEYPARSLKSAREYRARCRAWLVEGIDPAKAKWKKETPLTFEDVGREWFDKFSPTWAPNTVRARKPRLEKNVYPLIGKMPIADIEPPDVLAVLRRIEQRGSLDMAERVKRYVGQIMRYGIACGYCKRDVTADLRGAIARKKVAHFGSITDPRKVGELLRAIEGYEGDPAVMFALRVSPYVFVRPSELRKAIWAEFDFDAAEWRIPPERMKMGQRHIVPLATQVVALLQELRPFTERSRFLFPSPRSLDRPLSDMALTAALRRIGYAPGEMTPHGFRSMASTRLHEEGWPSDVIERQLAHVQGNSVKAAYNYAQHLPERRKMMQWWADYLDRLREAS